MSVSPSITLLIISTCRLVKSLASDIALLNCLTCSGDSLLNSLAIYNTLLKLVTISQN